MFHHQFDGYLTNALHRCKGRCWDDGVCYLNLVLIGGALFCDFGL